LNDFLAPDVDCAGSLIEDEDRGLADNSAGNGNTLTLATGELGTTVADGCIVAL
jgi:hypothetical protein